MDRYRGTVGCSGQTGETRSAGPTLTDSSSRVRCGDGSAPEARKSIEGSVVAGATFDATMAEALAVLERADRAELSQALEQLTEATQALTDSIGSHG
jgi:hypothetical protein